jgi:two-component system, NtrC family, sensor kinase
MGTSIFGLHSFHLSYLTFLDQMREVGLSADLMRSAARLRAPETGSPQEIAQLKQQVEVAQQALRAYFDRLKENAKLGSRVDSGTDELGLAFLIDDDLAAILSELDPLHPPPDRKLPGTEYYAVVGCVGTIAVLLLPDRKLPGTEYYVEHHPELLPQVKPATGLSARIERLNETVMELPKRLYEDFWAVLKMSQNQYHVGRIIVWISSLMVLGMLCGLTLLFHRWVLLPLRLLQRGVRHVARGSFNYKIDLRSGDEMQDLAEAFNDMTSKISVTYADLEQQVQERSRQLVRSERLAGVGFLAAGVAHEINNPLASIAFCAEALDHRLERLLKAPEEADKGVVVNYLKMIQEEAFRCKNITEKLLDFSRCNDIKRERTDLAGLIQGVVEMIRHIGKYTGKNIIFHPREAVMAHVDAQEIKQVVLNLIVNALESMGATGTLKIDARYNQGMAEMAFTDNGCGMPPAVLENIFEPFFTKRRDGKGTGLGLSITHRIVNQHHGEIMARSPGTDQGSTFTVRLPIDPTEISDQGVRASNYADRLRSEPALAL